MQLQFGCLLVLMAVSYVMNFPIEGRSKNVKFIKRSLKDNMLHDSGLPGVISGALVDQPAEESRVPKVRTKRTLAQLQVAYTLQVVCTDNPKHPDCKADIIDDGGRSYRSRRRQRHHRRNRTRAHRQ